MSFLSQPITLQSLFGENRQIDSIEVDVILNEHTVDSLTVTKQPVQTGTSITDHSFKEPTSLSMTILQKDNFLLDLSDVYQQFLDLQDTREPFSIVTPKRDYDNMLMTSIGLTTDKATENCLSLSLTFQEIIIVNVLTALIPRALQKIPKVTAGIQSVGRKSFLKVATGG